MYSLEEMTDSLGVELDETQKKAIKLFLNLIKQTDKMYTSNFKYSLGYMDVVQELLEIAGML